MNNTVSLKDLCIVNTGFENHFVGIKSENDKIQVFFPLGFNLSNDDISIRKDILLLISILKESNNKLITDSFNIVHESKNQFPIDSYIYIIKDFISRGIYKEKIINHRKNNSGKINWSKTISQLEPFISNNKPYYLNFIVKENNIHEDNILSHIHKYFVYESFNKLGWLFSEYTPPKTELKLSLEFIKKFLNHKIHSTNIDKDKFLFISILNIIAYISKSSDCSKLQFGTNNFEYVWEFLIDKTFGIKNKNIFFPKTYWIINSKQYNNSSLEPDTIMHYDNIFYILDAKYYKYGITNNIKDLPSSSSVHKQITYGEYVAENPFFKDKYGQNLKVFNAFILPFNGNNKYIIKYIGTAISNWKSNNKTYEKVPSFLIDTKYLMQISKMSTTNIIKLLATEIQNSI